MKINLIYEDFLKKLAYYKEKGWIKLLYRGIDEEFAFKLFTLDIECDSISQFAERLFFYGEKSRYFWQQKTGRKFLINDISDSVFDYIFDLFNQIALKNDVKAGTIRYKSLNKSVFFFFLNENNRDVFNKKINLLNTEEKKQYRNYYFRIIHQLGETDYKESSIYFSSSSAERVAKKFSKRGIIANFWDIDFKNFLFIKKSVPFFNGRPYKTQKEISVFSAIFPHYIYSFKYKDKLYLNPALFASQDMDSMILNGFDIDQANFDKKLIIETNFQIGIQKNGDKYMEIKS